METCKLCPRNCGVSRKSGNVGYCGMPDELILARAALHHWEEPVISGNKGSGTVFFSGCPLRCVFCQNADIAIGKQGIAVSEERLVEIFFELKEQGANNINLVTPTHYVHKIIPALQQAKNQGLGIPVVYNTGSYEKVETLKMLEGLVDIYLPDLKYQNRKLAGKYSKAEDYFQVAAAAIEEMIRQTGTPVFAEEGALNKMIEYSGDEENVIMKKGVLIRHLILPGQLEDSKRIIDYIMNHYGNRVYVSLMNQYTPFLKDTSFPELSRKLTEQEYDAVIDYAIEKGLEQGFIQEGDTAKESFLPKFNGVGIIENSL